MSSKYKVPALEKTIDILNLISSNSNQNNLTATQICAKLSISKTTVFSILKVLEEHNIVKKNEGGEYELGIKLYEWGKQYVSEADVVEVAHKYMEKLMKETGYTVHLGVIENGEMLYVDKVEPDTFIRFSSFPGMRSDFHVTSLGKAIGAFLNEQETNRMLSEKRLTKYTQNTITDPRQLKNEFAVIREQGYSIEDEEGEVGVRCIGAPIFCSEEVVASVSIAGHTSSLDIKEAGELVQQIKSTATQISEELG